ncbi:MAG: type II toxin-antitoxin system VapC family toxin [Bryobacteraceae bacterium]
MRTAIDTNVISALWSREPGAAEMAKLLGQAQNEGGLVISAPVYVELLAHPKASANFVDRFLVETSVTTDFNFSEAIWREAARAFADHSGRRRKGTRNSPKRLLADFLIGAHAFLEADRLLTLDPSRYQADFPGLQLIPQPD